jgi:hypothetical protein
MIRAVSTGETSPGTAQPLRLAANSRRVSASPLLLPLLTAVSSFTLFLALPLGTLASSDAQPPGCEWNGPSVEWVLARRPPAGEVAGTVTGTIVPLLQRSGIPLCFVSTAAGDEQVTLKAGAAANLRELLDEVVRQAPGYRFAAIDGRVVLYPKGPIFDAPVDLGKVRTMTRAAAYFFVLEGLREKTKVLQGLFPSLRSEGARSEPEAGGAGGDKMPYSDEVEVGGNRSLLEHLVSLVQLRPQRVFSVSPSIHGKVYFEFVSINLLDELVLHAPSTAGVGETFVAAVTAKLADGTVVSLTGPECGVSYTSSDPTVVEIDDAGKAAARKRGIAVLAAKYESRRATAQIKVQ